MGCAKRPMQIDDHEPTVTYCTSCRQKREHIRSEKQNAQNMKTNNLNRN